MKELRRTQRKAADCTDLLLKLRCYTGIERKMSRVMRARCDLVHAQRAAALEEEFDAECADIVESLGDRPCDLDSLLCRRVGNVGPREGNIENMICVVILDNALLCELTFLPTSTNDGNFLLKCNELLKYRFLPVQGIKSSLDLAVDIDPSLAFAVIAETRGLQYCRKPKIFYPFEKVFDRADASKPGERKAVL